MEDAVHAFIMAFSIIIFVIGLTVTVQMFSKITNTADTLLYYADESNYYDNLKFDYSQAELNDPNFNFHNTDINRTVDLDTIIPNLYRYYKENFCVKIYDANYELIQFFDVNIEGEVKKAAAERFPNKKQQALRELYNDRNERIYMFEAPWIGSTDDDMKARIDYFVNGKAGYIKDTYVNYENNEFYKIREHNRTAAEDAKIYFTENFINYTYTGDTITTEEGDILVGNAQPKDKIIITYTAQGTP